MYVSRVTGAFEESFRLWMMKEKQFSNNHAVRQLSSLKTVFTWAMKVGLVKLNPFMGVDLKKDKPADPIFLSQAELSLLEKHIFRSNRLDRVRDLFLIQCYTGLSYVDLVSLTKENFVRQQGRLFLIKKREKSQVKFYAPLLSKPFGYF